jgi:hypothetical protein
MGSRCSRRLVGKAQTRVRLHPGVLGRRQLAVQRRLGPFLDPSPFYLAGGTALALQLGHRRSVDFDWFSERPLTDPLRLATDIEGFGVALDVDGVEKGTLHARSAGVRLSFLEYRYPLLRPLLATRELGLSLASLEDIAAMKLAAVAQRGSRKDFVDVFALGRVMDLGEMLAHYRRKYRLRDVGHVLFALSYFDDAERERMPVMLRRWSWAEIRRAIQGWVRQATA